MHLVQIIKEKALLECTLNTIQNVVRKRGGVVVEPRGSGFDLHKRLRVVSLSKTV